MQALDAWTSEAISKYQVKEYSFAEWIDAAEMGAKKYSDDSSVRRRGIDSVDFYGSESWEQTINFAKLGDNESTRIVKLYSEKIERQFTFASLSDYMMDVQGQTIDIGTLLTGNPEHWLVPVETHSVKSDKLVEISLDSTFSGSIDAKSIAYRGALIAALVDALRVRGFSVKLTITFTTNNAHKSPVDKKEYEGFVNKVIIINYGEIVDLSRVAFALANTSMYRRMEFMNKCHFTGHSASTGNPTQCPVEHRSKVHFVQKDGLFDIGFAPSERQLNESVKWLEAKITELTETLNTGLSR